MSFDLIQFKPGGRAIKRTNTFWIKALHMAKDYGWEPAGVEWDATPIPTDEWGLYFINHGQKMSAKDASALADALESSLVDISDRRDPSLAIYPVTDPGEFAELWVIKSAQELVQQGKGFFSSELYWNPKAYFGVYKADLLEFISFLREGEFVIL